MSAQLTASEQHDLETLEGIVQRGIATFIEVGRALTEIRDRRLYRATHRTFEEYCDQRWLLSRTRAYRLMDAAAVADALSPIGDTTPANEAQARELVPLWREDEHELQKVWAQLRRRWGDKLTAAKIHRAVHEALRCEEKVQCPECGRLIRYAAPHRCAKASAASSRPSPPVERVVGTLDLARKFIDALRRELEKSPTVTAGRHAATLRLYADRLRRAASVLDRVADGDQPEADELAVLLDASLSSQIGTER